MLTPGLLGVERDDAVVAAEVAGPQPVQVLSSWRARLSSTLAAKLGEGLD